MGPFKCPDCGIWWAGLEHRCGPPGSDTGASRPETWVIRPYVPPTSTGGTTSAPWCPVCEGWHIPGAGPCTVTYSVTD